MPKFSFVLFNEPQVQTAHVQPYSVNNKKRRRKMINEKCENVEIFLTVQINANTFNTFCINMAHFLSSFWIQINQTCRT